MNKTNGQQAQQTSSKFEFNIGIKKAFNGLVYGVVYEPNVVDAHGDHTTAEEIERAAHNFLPNAVMNLEHQPGSELNKVEVVESFIAPCDFSFPESDDEVSKGSWVLVTRVNDPEIKAAIEKGDLTGYSLEGHANKIGD